MTRKILYFVFHLSFKLWTQIQTTVGENALIPATLPMLLWDPRNPMFNESLCPRSTSFEALEKDNINILCPNSKLHNYIANRFNDVGDSYYNIYVTDRKDVLESRDSTRATYVDKCTNERVSVKGNFLYVVNVRNISVSRYTRPVLKPGYTYYFFTTSDGTEASLTNKIGTSPKTAHMKFTVKICKEGEQCAGRTKFYQCPTVFQPTSAPNTGSETIISTSKFAVCIISAVVGGVVLGLFCGILLNRKKYRRQNRATNDADVDMIPVKVSTGPGEPLFPYSNGFKDGNEKELVTSA